MTKEIKNGSKSVIISNQNTAGIYESRIFVNNGQTAGYQNAEHKTLKGAERWAKRTLGL